MRVFHYLKSAWEFLEIPRGVQNVILVILMLGGLLLAMSLYLVCKQYLATPVTRYQ